MDCDPPARTTDEALSAAITALVGRMTGSASDVHVTASHGDVTLTGTAPSRHACQAIAAIVAACEGVASVRAEMSVRAPDRVRL